MNMTKPVCRFNDSLVQILSAVSITELTRVSDLILVLSHLQAEFKPVLTSQVDITSSPCCMLSVILGDVSCSAPKVI